MFQRHILEEEESQVRVTSVARADVQELVSDREVVLEEARLVLVFLLCFLVHVGVAPGDQALNLVGVAAGDQALNLESMSFRALVLAPVSASASRSRIAHTTRTRVHFILLTFSRQQRRHSSFARSYTSGRS